MPYYYYNNLYYTWNPGYNGYVVTDPPPAAGRTPGLMGRNCCRDRRPRTGQGGAGADLYVYPRNGQSDPQTSTDRYECHSWAVTQTGFDPTRGGQRRQADNYRRAMVACLDARGYSARDVGAMKERGCRRAPAFIGQLGRRERPGLPHLSSRGARSAAAMSACRRHSGPRSPPSGCPSPVVVAASSVPGCAASCSSTEMLPLGPAAATAIGLPRR